MTLLTVIILLVIAAGMYYTWVTHKSESDSQGPIVQLDKPEPTPEPTPEPQPPVEEFYSSLEQKEVEPPVKQVKQKRPYKKKAKSSWK